MTIGCISTSAPKLHRDISNMFKENFLINGARTLDNLKVAALNFTKLSHCYL